MAGSNLRVNEGFIEARVRDINDTIQTLKGLTARGFNELTIYEKLSIRYLTIQLVEAASSICMHILLNSFNERAEGYSDCFTRLGDKDVISRELAERLSSAARLRNLLVHRYWAIVDEKVYRSVREGLEDFEHFTSYVRKFLSGSTSIGKLDPVDLEFRYYELSAEERARLLDFLRKRLERVDEIIFAYVHGGFLERNFFRDVDVAVWISDLEKAFYYTVDFSAKLEVEAGLPVDLHVLNEAPLPFKHHVFTTGILLFSKDEMLRHRIIDQVMKEYIDLKLTEKLSTEKL
jgi:uncharacterized protein YutE (UPF0331/DUF86 family)/predicted nucleotidyltransferase